MICFERFVEVNGLTFRVKHAKRDNFHIDAVFF